MPEGSPRSRFPAIAIRKKHFWRCLPKRYLPTILEAGPSFTRERRYSIRGEFGALYFSAAKELSLYEMASRAGNDLESMSCVEFEVSVDQVVDLTRPEIRAKLHVHLSNLVLPRISKDAYAVPQEIARRVYEDELSGILAPSIYDPNGDKKSWFNLILYPANLLRVAIRDVRIEDLPSPAR